MKEESRDSWVGIATGFWLEGCGLISDQGEMFSLSIVSRQASYPVSIGVLFPGVKRQGYEADHSRPPSIGVKNGGAIPPLSHTSSWHNV
jgi:hypothetical protein